MTLYVSIFEYNTSNLSERKENFYLSSDTYWILIGKFGGKFFCKYNKKVKDEDFIMNLPLLIFSRSKWWPSRTCFELRFLFQVRICIKFDNRLETESVAKSICVKYKFYVLYNWHWLFDRYTCRRSHTQISRNQWVMYRIVWIDEEVVLFGCVMWCEQTLRFRYFMCIFKFLSNTIIMICWFYWEKHQINRLRTM